MSHPAIETRELSKSYGDTPVVDNLSMSVPDGAIYCRLGRNGAGKTTTIRILLGLAHADSGSAKVLGLDCNSSASTSSHALASSATSR